jgi:hypothetical protein
MNTLRGGPVLSVPWAFHPGAQTRPIWADDPCRPIDVGSPAIWDESPAEKPIS